MVLQHFSEAPISFQGKTRKDLTDLVKSFINERVPGPLVAGFFHGSAQRGDHNNYSDIDIAVVVRGNNAFKRRKCLFRNFLIDYVTIGDEQFDRHLTDARLRAAKLDVVPFADGLIVEGDVEEAAKLREAAQSVLNAGPYRRNSEATTRLLRGLSAALLDLSQEKDEQETCGVALEVYLMLLELVQCGEGVWRERGRYSAEMFERNGHHTYTDLLAALRSALSGDAQLLLGVSSDIAKLYGGLRWSS